MSETKEQAKTPSGKTADEQLENMMSGEKKKKHRRLAIIAIIVVAALLWFVVKPIFFGGSDSVDTGYINYTVEKQNLTISISGSGALLPADSYDITALVSGDILSADFEEGDYVNKDDLLYQIDSSDAEKSIEQAKISLQNAQLSYQNTLDTLDGLEPKATVSGRLSKLYVEAGDDVSSGSAIADIADTDNMVLSVYFHSTNADAIFSGMSAAVTMSGTGETVYGTVTSVSGITTVGTGGALLREVKITVQNPGGIAAGAAATAVVGSYSCAQSGTFAAKTSSTVYASVSGTVSKLYVREGDLVSKDASLMKIVSDSASRQIQSSELSLHSSQISLENAENTLDNYSIKAPISGTVVEKNLKAGDKLVSSTASTTMAVIYDMSYLTLTLNVDELDISSIKVGQKVTIEAQAVSGETFEGYVDRVGVNGTVASGVTTYPVRIILTDYEGLMPGMNVTADIVIDEVTDALTIPVSAVSRNNLVLLADAASQGDEANGVPAGYRQVEVKIGKSTDDYIEILSGLSEGDKVGVNGTPTSGSGFFGMMSEDEQESAPQGGENGPPPSGGRD
ncbi:MAG: efflux RND transporter periplasmic adaptor subunit [Clostridiaceae bacterium]|nr:efflux RND transporter periplasmic adaptor subunit [Clostridiaceae bacterium]